MISHVKIAISKVNDGTMKRVGNNLLEVDTNRQKFLDKHGASLERAVLVQLDYDSEEFCRYSVVDAGKAGEGMVREGRIADGLATREKGLMLFLPLADCVGAVLYDPTHEALMLTHLGRHNLEQNGGQKSVEFMTKQFGTDPSNIEVTLSPSAGAEHYPLHTFDNKSLQEVTCEQLISGGVLPGHITRSAVDTTKDAGYFSHSEYLKGNRESDGRFAIVAALVH